MFILFIHVFYFEDNQENFQEVKDCIQLPLYNHPQQFVLLNNIKQDYNLVNLFAPETQGNKISACSNKMIHHHQIP